MINKAEHIIPMVIVTLRIQVLKIICLNWGGGDKMLQMTDADLHHCIVFFKTFHQRVFMLILTLII